MSFNTSKKRSDSISKYLQKIKDARDHLTSASVVFEDVDIIILAFKGLTAESNTFRCVIRGRANGISSKDFRSQLLVEEATINQSLDSSMSFGTAMVVGAQASKWKSLVLDSSSTDSSTYGSSSRGGPNQPNNKQSNYSGNQNGGDNNGPQNYTGGYNGGYKSNNYKPKAEVNSTTIHGQDPIHQTTTLEFLALLNLINQLVLTIILYFKSSNLDLLKCFEFLYMVIWELF